MVYLSLTFTPNLIIEVFFSKKRLLSILYATMSQTWSLFNICSLNFQNKKVPTWYIKGLIIILVPNICFVYQIWSLIFQTAVIISIMLL